MVLAFNMALAVVCECEYTLADDVYGRLAIPSAECESNNEAVSMERRQLLIHTSVLNV